MEMEVLIQRRKPIRASFTRIYNGIKFEIDKENPDEEFLRSKLTTLKRLADELRSYDIQILDSRYSSEEQFNSEWESVEEYKEKLDLIQVKVEMFFSRQIAQSVARTAEEIGCHSNGTETLIHALFGGATTKRETHKRYEVSLSSLYGNYSRRLNLLEQLKICGPVTSLQPGPWIEEMKQKGITVSDVGRKDLKIEILIGADVAGALLTGKVHKLENGLVAVESLLGWTVMGRINYYSSKSNVSIYPGKDGNIRVVRVKTASEELVRPIKKIFPLEIPSSMESDEKNETATLEKENIISESQMNNSVPKLSQKFRTIVTRSGRQIKLPSKFIT
ncbi:hypothetical protein HNY73_002439 [Argiope bruennichi]|uniref:DUF5641 domain-containing protein n=1 Tax=Argiope bruennichi TaxID=94029 RepID=A0A8T0FXU4_ARGBR|nr:hypothetical protein HNY73_002439 [Argiope bruennichi]